MPHLAQATEPFVFQSRLTLPELTTIKARTARQLLNAIRIAPEAAIYHHTHHYLEQHRFLSPEPANDFAYWARQILGDRVLGELLASVDIIQYSSIAQVRESFIDRLEGYLAGTPLRRAAPPGEEFRFMKSVTFVIPAGYEAWTLTEFRAGLQAVTVHSLYFHMFEARLRLGALTNDFSAWLENSLHQPELAVEIEGLDPYTHTMEGLRRRIDMAIARRLPEISHA